MEKTIVSQEYLLSWMNSQIAKYDKCTNCHFTSILILSERDEGGCNWSSVNLRCSGDPIDVCRPIAQRVVDEAKKKFNVD